MMDYGDPNIQSGSTYANGNVGDSASASADDGESSPSILRGINPLEIPVDI